MFKNVVVGVDEHEGARDFARAARATPVITTIVALAALATMFAGCASTTGTSAGSGATPGSSPQAPAPVSAPPAKPQTFTGTGQMSLGTINVLTDTTVSWSCPSCSNDNFIINNAQSDSSSFATNGLNQTSGVDPLSAGVYHTVVVNTTSGPWSISIGGTATAPAQGQPPAQGSVPTAKPQTFTGSGQTSLGTINVPTDTTVSWSCPSCGNDNFIINNAQSDGSSFATNGLNQTSGVDPLSAGVYHTVVVDTTSGPWSISIGGTATAPAQGQRAPAASPSQSAGDPASTLRSHLQDLGSGQYQAAFNLMSSGYQAQNPSWVQTRSAANPGINVISVGTPQSGAGAAQVPVDFYARDRNPTSGSDTQCRHFQGTASMTSEGGTWRYDPGGNSLSATVLPASAPNCP